MSKHDPRKHGQAARLLWMRYQKLLEDGHEKEAEYVKTAAEAMEAAQAASVEVSDEKQ